MHIISVDRLQSVRPIFCFHPTAIVSQVASYVWAA